MYSSDPRIVRKLYDVSERLVNPQGTRPIQRRSKVGLDFYQYGVGTSGSPISAAFLGLCVYAGDPYFQAGSGSNCARLPLYSALDVRNRTAEYECYSSGVRVFNHKKRIVPEPDGDIGRKPKAASSVLHTAGSLVLLSFNNSYHLSSCPVGKHTSLTHTY